MVKIALMGSPSTGKSTLAAGVFTALKNIGENGELIQEYIREYIYKHGVPSSVLFQAIIFDKQFRRELAIPEDLDFFVTDSPITLCYLYGLHYSNPKDLDEREMIAHLYNNTLEDLYRYDMVYVLEHNFEPVDDGVRYQRREEIDHIQNMITHFLKTHKIPYKTLSKDTDTEKRVKTIVKDYKKLIKKT